MEMLPDFSVHFRVRLLTLSMGQDVDHNERSGTCVLVQIQTQTETMRFDLSIICIEAASWRQIFYKWRESHNNNFIAGLIENLIGSGTSSIGKVETLTKTAVAANAELTSDLVHDMGEEPMSAIIAKSGLKLQSLHHVGGHGESLDTEHTQIRGRVPASGGGITTGALEVIRGRGQVEAGGRAPSTMQGRVSYNMQLGASDILPKMELESEKVTITIQLTSVKRSTSEGEEAQQVIMSRAEARDTQRAFPNRAITERRRVPALSELSCLQTRSQDTHKESRNLSPDVSHSGTRSVISNHSTQYNPAGPLWGKGTQHAAVSRLQLGKATSIGVAGPTRFDMVTISAISDDRVRYNYRRAKMSSSTKACEGK